MIQKIVIGRGGLNSAKTGASIEANLAKKLHSPKVVEEYTGGKSPLARYTTLKEALIPNFDPSTIMGIIDL